MVTAVTTWLCSSWTSGTIGNMGVGEFGAVSKRKPRMQKAELMGPSGRKLEDQDAGRNCRVHAQLSGFSRES